MLVFVKKEIAGVRNWTGILKRELFRTSYHTCRIIAISLKSVNAFFSTRYPTVLQAHGIFGSISEATVPSKTIMDWLD